MKAYKYKDSSIISFIANNCKLEVGYPCIMFPEQVPNDQGKLRRLTTPRFLILTRLIITQNEKDIKVLGNILSIFITSVIHISVFLNIKLQGETLSSVNIQEDDGASFRESRNGN